MKTLLLESVAGVAGDMFTAAFLDAGLVSSEAVKGVPAALGLGGVEIEITSRTTASMEATHLRVETGEDSEQHLGLDGGHGHHHHHHHHEHEHHHHGRTHREIDALLEASELPPSAAGFARSVFELLAEAEAAAHGIPVDEVHFHEVGSLDSIVDVALAGLCVSSVEPGRSLATPVKLGRGYIEIQHGTHAVPPPASARLAEGFTLAEVPSAITRADVELSTPTGLAILKALSPTFVREWPAGTLIAQGMGCGTMDLGSYPNVFRVALLETAEEGAGDTGAETLLSFATDRVMEISFNVDDESGERVAWITERLLGAGALDVWWTSIGGKKGRPAVQISLLANPTDWAGLAGWALRHTSTFGVRHRLWDRVKLERSIESREKEGREIRYKVGRTRTGEVVKEKPEFEDVRGSWDDGSP